MKKATKKEILKEVKRAKSASDYKKVKKKAMHSSVKLGKERKNFCKYCFSPLKGRLRIKKGIKSVKCEKCGKTNRWKL